MKTYFYLVFLTLLTLSCTNSSKRVEKATLMCAYFSNIERCEQLSSEFIDHYKNLPDSSKSKIEIPLKILDLQIAYIDSVQDSLFTFTNNPKINLTTNLFDQLDECQDLENYKIPTKFLIGEDPASPHNLKFGAWQIQERLIDSNKKIKSELP